MIQEVITADAFRPLADDPEDSVLQTQGTSARGLVAEDFASIV